MSKFINSIVFRNYRGFREECTLELADEKNMTILVGPNNSGKSLITRAFAIFKEDIEQFTSNVFRTTYIQDSDFHNFDINSPITYKFNINTQVFIDRQEPYLVKLSKIPNIFLSFEIRKIDGNFLCCIYLSRDNDSTHEFDVTRKQFVYKIMNKLSEDIEMNQHEIEDLCRKLYYEVQSRVLAFDAIRSFDRTESDFYKNGSELVNWIHEQRSQAEIRDCRRQVRVWLKNIFNLDDPSTVTANFEKKQLIFTFNDNQFSSDEIGTGYTMLYILLMEIVRNKKEIVIIDEIESHLQPGLVRLLIQLIREHGDSQYIIATHSPNVLESATGNDILYRFNKDGEICFFENFFRNSESLGKFREVCNELGVIPGDALLSNVVIWVEGPSEMFWLRAWLKVYLQIYKREKRIDCNLIEGMHFSILMTGGSNIAHYGFEEGEVSIELIEEEEVLKVLKINPNPFVIIDSDNTDVSSAKFQRMLRIARELNYMNQYNPKFKHLCLSEIDGSSIHQITNLWVLKGRELENYAHPQLLKEFYVKRSGASSSKITGALECLDWNVYSSSDGAGYLLEQRGVKGIAKASGTIIHKNDLARFIFRSLSANHFEINPSDIEKPNEDMINDLKDNLDKLISYILKINGLIQNHSPEVPSVV
ncbi:ATP-dependent nuclease [Priestia koreensis]|uniref:ATP-dependent nuclease n=1 Tax=Priestia koreensis TaxID=284581 RepID=UPI001F582750|nr:ATP-binding protein [Priestia koreensis]UNL85727.1 AAA family ATPase [Priestia koreensis]